jgi:glycosyltransferase involved in cell wall biosynthesis
MLPELHSGGVERGTLELGRYLAGQGHRSMVISAGGPMVEQLEAEGSQHIQWSVEKKSLSSLKYIPRLRNLLKKEKVDILHLRSRLPAWIGYLAWKGLDRTNRPKLVTTFHGFYSINAYSGVMAKGERVIAISKTIRDHIIEHYSIPAERIMLIHRGVDEDEFDSAVVSDARIDALVDQWEIDKQSGPVIMLPGRITSWKGQDVFLKSLDKLRHLSWTAICVGEIRKDSNYTKRVLDLINHLKLQDRVRFTGIEAEAFGRIAIEAQAMGRAVIATAHGGSLETILPGKTGWLVKPDDPGSLAKAIQAALDDRQRLSAYGREGRKWVLENFTTAIMCKKTVSLYYELLGEAGDFKKS